MSSASTITLTVDGKQVEVPSGSTVMQACHALDIEVPHFCYHERLSVAGNCRMCMVQIEGGPPKPVASCAWPAAEGMVVHTKSPLATEARKGTMEFLLINHPLDCPICDQGGECDLQDMAVSYGSDRSRFTEQKRAVEDKDIGPLIKTVMTRCIHCTRCVRFATEIAGVEEFGATGRGEETKIGTYVEHALQSELCGNMIDLCPVGALTNKPYAYTARPWELVRTPAIDVMDAVGSHIEVHHRAGEVMRIIPRECNDINEEWIADTARFAYDALKRNRITMPAVDGNNTHWQVAFQAIQKAADKAKPKAIAGLSGEILCAEDQFSFAQFMRKVLGTENMDCRPGWNLPYTLPRSHYILNTPINRLEEADAVLLVGCDPRFEAPLVNARLRKITRRGELPVANIGAPLALTYPVRELGTSPELLHTLLEENHPFTKVLHKAKHPLMILGAETVFARADALHIVAAAQQLAEKTGVITEGWNGFGVLQQHTGRLSGMDMGVFPGEKGMDAAAIKAALDKGNVELLVLYGNPEINVELARKAKFLVYMGTHHNGLSKVADVVLPTAAHTEKSGWWVNVEGRVQESPQATAAPLQAKENWKIFRALSEVLGKNLPFNSQKQLRALIAEQGGAAYQQIGAVQASPWQALPLASGKMLNAPLEQPVHQFYVNNSLLKNSAIMMQCQENADRFKVSNQMKRAV